MSDRNLLHYFNTNGMKHSLSPPADAVEKEDPVTLNETASDDSIEIISKRRRTSNKKAVKYAEEKEDDDVDFENDPILPPPTGNSITKYFSPVDKSIVARKTRVKPCVVTVEAQVHGSPKKVPKLIIKKVPGKKRKKKKIGISGSQGDVIEFVSSEVMPQEDNIPTAAVVNEEPALTDTSVVLIDKQDKPEDSTKAARKSIKPTWTMRICLEENIKASSDGGMFIWHTFMFFSNCMCKMYDEK